MYQISSLPNQPRIPNFSTAMKTLDSPAIEQGNDSCVCLTRSPIVHAFFILKSRRTLHQDAAVLQEGGCMLNSKNRKMRVGRTVSQAKN